MINKSQKARLESAYFWTCDNCCRGNFERAIKAELTDDDREEMFRAFHSMDAWAELPEGWQDFEMVTRPDSVTCSECHAEFKTEDDRASEDE